MRTIKRITHLRMEQKRLQRREAELEQIIRQDWKSIRQDWKALWQHRDPGRLTRGILSSTAAWIGRKLFATTLKKQHL